MIEIILIFFIPILLRVFTLSNFHAFSLAGLLISEPSNISSDSDNGNIHYPTFLKTIAESLISEPSSTAPITPVPHTNPSEEVPVPEPVPQSTERSQSITESLSTADSIDTFDSQAFTLIHDLFQDYIKYMGNIDTDKRASAIKSIKYAEAIFTKEALAQKPADIPNPNHIVNQFLYDLKQFGSFLSPNERLHLCQLKTAIALHNIMSGSQKEITSENLDKALEIYNKTLNRYINE